MTTPEAIFSPVFLVWKNTELEFIPYWEYYQKSWDDYHHRQTQWQPLVYRVGAMVETARMKPRLKSSFLHLQGGGWVVVLEQNPGDQTIGELQIKGVKAFCSATSCPRELEDGLVVRYYSEALYPICPSGHERYINEHLLGRIRRFEITTDGRVVFGNLRG